MTVLRSGSASDVGRVRTVNEDLALESLTLFAVADGMGGHVGGEVAARTAIDTLRTEFTRASSVDGLVGAVRLANQAVWEAGRADQALRGMGTTLVAAALVTTDDGDRLVLTNVGDSRAYRLHGGELSQLSVDHSVAEELVARGELSEAEAAVHPHRHILTRALGVAPEVDVDVWQVVPEEGDRFVLCSDGLTNEIPVAEMTDVLTESRDPQEVATTLVAKANRAGGNDNITVVVLDVVVGDHPGAAAAGGVVGGEASGRGSGGAGAGADAPGQAAGVGASGPQPGTGGAGSAAGVVVASPPGTTVAPGVAGLPAPSPSPPNGAGTGVGGRVTVPGGAQRGRTAAPVRPTVRVPRRITFRVILFIILLGGVVYGGYSVIRWYVNSSYFVGLNHGKVVIYEGRRGGFVGIEPKIVTRYDMTTSQVPSIDLGAVRSGVEESSLNAAKSYVTKVLQQGNCFLKNAPPSCSTSTTTSPTSTVASTPASTVALPERPRIGGAAALAMAGAA